MVLDTTRAQTSSKPIGDAIEDLYLSICREIAEICLIDETKMGNKHTHFRDFYMYFKGLLTITRNDPGVTRRGGDLITRVDLWFSLKKSFEKLDTGILLAEEYNKILFDSGILTLGSTIRKK